MNIKQQQWTQNKCEQLKTYLEQSFPLTQEQWESVADYITKIVDMAKGNAEVRKAFFDVVEQYEIKEREMKKNG